MCHLSSRSQLKFDAQRSPLFDVRAPDVSIVLAVRNWTLLATANFGGAVLAAQGARHLGAQAFFRAGFDEVKGLGGAVFGHLRFEMPIRRLNRTELWATMMIVLAGTALLAAAILAMWLVKVALT